MRVLPHPVAGRQIKAATGLADGTVNWYLKDLTERGILRRVLQANRFLYTWGQKSAP
jgi:hypothetical protein